MYSKKVVAKVKGCTFSIAKVTFIAGDALSKLLIFIKKMFTYAMVSYNYF